MSPHLWENDRDHVKSLKSQEKWLQLDQVDSKPATVGSWEDDKLDKYKVVRSLWQGIVGCCMQGQIKEKWRFMLLLLTQDKEYLAQYDKSGNGDQRMIWKDVLYNDLW